MRSWVRAGEKKPSCAPFISAAAVLFFSLPQNNSNRVSLWEMRSGATSGVGTGRDSGTEVSKVWFYLQRLLRFHCRTRAQDATLRQQQPPCSPALEGEELRSQCKTWKKTLFYFSIFLDSVEIFLFPCKVTHHLYSVAFHEPGGGSCIKLRLGKSCLSGCSFGRGLMIIWRCLVSSLVVSLLYLLPYLKLNGQVWYLPDFKMRAVKLFFRITWFYALLIWTGVKPSQFSVAGYCVLPRQSKKINK